MTLLFLYGGYGVAVPVSTGYINVHTRIPDHAMTMFLLDTSPTVVYEDMGRVTPEGDTRVTPEGDARISVYDTAVNAFIVRTKTPNTALTIGGKNLAAATVISEDTRVTPESDTRVTPEGDTRIVEFDSAARLPALHVYHRDYNFSVRSPDG